MELPERFMKTFEGLKRAHGVYNLTDDEVSAGQKKTGKAYTKGEPYTLEHWKDHLAGGKGLGIVPIMDDSNVWWACIDVDQYDLDHVALCDKLVKTPFVPTRTKSGGLHLFVFFKEPTPAEYARNTLKKLAADLGFAGSEIFPKQTKLMSNQGDAGNWLNMPYFNVNKTKRYGYGTNGQPLTAGQFLDIIERRRTTVSALAAAGKRLRPEMSGTLADGPPCLQFLCASGFPKGTRNNGLFSLGVYYRKAEPDHWKQRLVEANEKYMEGGLDEDELKTLTKSLGKKGYVYRCNDEPCASHCERETCLGRKFGISDGIGALPMLSSLTKIDTLPPLYFCNVNDVRVGPFQMSDFLSQSIFRRIVAERCNIIMREMKAPQWVSTCAELMESVNIVQMPPDSSAHGQVLVYLREYCLGRAATENKEELLLGRVWKDGDDYYFRLQGFLNFLYNRRFYEFKQHQIATQFSEFGMECLEIEVKTEVMHVWRIHLPAPSTVTERKHNFGEKPY